ncbi:MAG: MBL fold metallo-hydrolase, partial [Paracoccaceae bacterium]
MRSPPFTPFSVGAMTVTPVLLGEISDRLRDWFPEGAQRVPDGTTTLPIICLHIAGPGCSVIVDVCDPACYAPEQGPLAQDAASAFVEVGVAPTDVTHVILTHGHHDHYCGLWDQKADRPVFPNARHVLSGRDWQGQSLTKSAMAADGTAADPTPLQRLHALGRLELAAPEPPLPPAI